MAFPRAQLGCCALALASTLLSAATVRGQVEVTPVTTLPMELPVGASASLDKFDVAAASGGRALVVWTEMVFIGSSSMRPRTIADRVFDPEAATFEPIFRHHFKGREPNLALGGAPGSFLTLWSQGGDSNDMQLFGRILGADGMALTAPSPLADSLVPKFGIFALAAEGGQSGHTIAYAARNGQVFARRVGSDGSASPEILVDPTDVAFHAGVTNTIDGGFVVGYGTLSPVRVRGYTAAGMPKSAAVQLSASDDAVLNAIVASPIDDVVAVVALDFDYESPGPYPLRVHRLSSSGIPLGAPVTLAEVEYAGADAAFDRNGDLYVVWAVQGEPLHMQTFYADGTPAGPSVSGTVPMGWYVRTARLTNGNFVNMTRVGTFMEYNVVSLCVPGTSVCGDGSLDPLCERCDAGSGNDDVTPDACRTDCELAHCGDGIIDTNETCDDGNTVDCDGCSGTCVVEAGLGCGDGVPFPACGEFCDDANDTDGDGCSSCSLERARGGGSAPSDCFTEWSIDNPTNEPRFGKSGAISDTQACADGDSSCDFDGVAGSCTFRVRVCVNNTEIAECTPGTRVRSWELRAPSTSQATAKPALEAIRSAFLTVVPGSVVGPSQTNLCSPFVDVPVALHGSPGHYSHGRVTLKTRTTLYDGRTDSDKLRLECLP